MQGKITKRAVDAAQPGARDAFIWDTETKGFGLKVTPTGNKIYVFQYRVPGRKAPERITIGNHSDPWTAEQARTEAEKYRGGVKRGIFPAAIKNAEKAEKTVAELCDLYLAHGCETKKPSTIATDIGRIERHIKPLLGRSRVKDIDQSDVRRFLQDVAVGKTSINEKTGKHGRARVTGGKGTASRTVGLLGGIFSFAVGEGMRADNPVRGVKRYADRKGDRYLSSSELTTLGEALSAAEAEGDNATAIAAIRLLILTGCRKSEILTLKWDYIDFERAFLNLPDSKTGEKIVPLGAPALELMASLPRIEGNPYVLPGEKEGRHFVDIYSQWDKLRRRAKLDGVRLHDLRHSFASVGASAGMGLPIVGKLLGHRDPKTTARYAHIADDPAKAAAEVISGAIAAALDGKSGKVVSLDDRGA
jgi:integrase